MAVGRVIRQDRYRPPHRGVPGLVPPYPDNQIMRAARLPSPPPLGADLTKTDQVWRLVYAYRGAVERTFGVPRPVFARGKLRESKFFGDLVVAATAAVEHEIAPIAWACWSTEVWVSGDGAQSKKPPPLTWVWSSNRIRGRRGWFGHEAGAFDGGRVYPSEAQLEYRRRYKLMMAELARLNPDPSESEIRRVVAAAFPDGWDDLMEDAWNENAKMQAALNAMVARGEWVW